MRLRLAILLASLLFLNVACQKGGIKLTFDPPLGSTFHMFLLKKDVMTYNFQGLEKVTEVTGNTGYRFVVKDKQEFTTTLEAFIESLKLRIKFPYGTFTFNSAKMDPTNTETNFFSFFYRQMIGKKIELIVKKDGSVLSVRGLDQWMEAILDSLGIQEQKVREEIIKPFQQIFAEKILRKSFDQVFRIFPQQKVELNDTWQTQETFEMPFGFTKTVTWKLTQITPQKVVIEGDGKIATPDSSLSPGPDLPEFKEKYHVWGIENSTFEIDPQTGWILSAKRLSFIKSKTTIQAKANEKAKFEFPLKFQELIRFLPAEAVQ